MNNSNDDPKKVVSYSRLSPEDEKAEDEVILAKIFSNLHQSSPQHKKSSNNRKKSITPKRADGVKVPGVCPDCGGKLGMAGDRHGNSFTVCENFKKGCCFFVPSKSSHFR